MQGAMSGESLHSKLYRLLSRGVLAMSAGQVEPCGYGSVPSRPVMSFWQHIAAFAAAPPCFVAEAIIKRCFEGIDAGHRVCRDMGDTCGSRADPLMEAAEIADDTQ